MPATRYIMFPPAVERAPLWIAASSARISANLADQRSGNAEASPPPARKYRRVWSRLQNHRSSDSAVARASAEAACSGEE
jgi:hypothetical protein